MKQIKEGFNNYTAPRQLIRKPQILLQIRNSGQRSNAQDQTLNELNRFYLVVYKWKSYLKWSKGDVGSSFSLLCVLVCAIQFLLFSELLDYFYVLSYIFYLFC